MKPDMEKIHSGIDLLNRGAGTCRKSTTDSQKITEEKTA